MDVCERVGVLADLHIHKQFVCFSQFFLAQNAPELAVVTADVFVCVWLCERW